MSIKNIKSYDDLLLEAKTTKYSEIWTESDRRNIEAEAVFFTAGSHNFRNKDRLNRYHSKLTNKKHRDETLTPEEEEFADNQDDMFDWQDSTEDVADNAEDAVEAMTDIDAVKGYDVVDTPSWQAPFTQKEEIK